MKLVITARDFSNTGKEAMKVLRDYGFEIEDHSEELFGSGSTEDEVIAASHDADIVIAGMETYHRRVLENCPKLKMISRRGIGYDNIDVDHCRSHGIKVARALGAVEDSVAEAVMSYILYFARRVDLQSKYMHDGQWHRLFMPGAKTRTLGLVGYGGVGKAIARKAAAFDMPIVYYVRHPSEEALEGAADEYGAVYKELDEVLGMSDYISINVPLSKETEYMVDREFISKMKKGSVLINIARGKVADEGAIKEALESGQLSGTAVDVFEKEPCTDSLLVGNERAVLTPHTAPFTEENFAISNLLAAQNIVNILDGTIDEKYVLV